MCLFARAIEHALNVPIQRLHDADARKHRWPVKFCDQQQRFDRGLPFIGIVFRFRQFGDVSGGIAQRAQGLAIDYDRIKKTLDPMTPS